MRRVLLALAAVSALALATQCSDHEVTATGPVPQVTFINPNPTHSDSMIIFIGTNFDDTATFTLRQNGEIKATLGPLVLADDKPERIQVDATIPGATPVGNYQACVTTRNGTGCYGLPVKVF
jgi:hypothetical protein